MWHQWSNRIVMKLLEYLFVSKENKNNDFVQQFILFHVSCRHAFMLVAWSIRVHSSAFFPRFTKSHTHTHMWCFFIVGLFYHPSLFLPPPLHCLFLSTAIISVSVICWGTFSFASELLNHNCDFKRVIKVKYGPDELLLQEMLWY